MHECDRSGSTARDEVVRLLHRAEGALRAQDFFTAQAFYEQALQLMNETGVDGGLRAVAETALAGLPEKIDGNE